MAPSGAKPRAVNQFKTPSLTPGPAESQASPQDGQPPKKKFKLTVGGRPTPSIDSDTIAVSRPKRTSAGKARYSQEVVLSESEPEESASEDDSSDLSSLDSKSVSEKADTPTAQQAPVMRKQNYGDFASYYILDGDVAEEEPEKEESPKPKPSSTKIKMKARQSMEKTAPKAPNLKSEPSMTPTPLPPPYPSIETRPQPSVQPGSLAPRHSAPRPLAPPSVLPMHHQQQQYQMPTNVPASMPVMPQRPAIPPPEPPVMEEIKVLYHAPVSQMVKNLEDLSEALTSFGGAPVKKKSPSPEKQTPAAQSTAPAQVDDFLAMFNDDSDSNEDEEKVDNDRVKSPGEQDAPLTYGIQFIMNALKSWAQQRLYNARLQGQVPPDAAQNGPADRPDDPYDLRHTLEGKAIAAFRRVVEAGCLQVNAVLPRNLSSALRTLYVQIDVLINSGNKPNQTWAPMSYSAQIAAHETRVRKALDHQNRAQQAVQEQQAIAHRQMMQQMGMAPMPHGHVPQNMQMSQPHPHDSQRRRSSSHAHHQQGSRGPTPQSTSVGFAHSPAHQNGPFPPQQYPGPPMYNMPPQHPVSTHNPQGIPPSGGKNHLDKMQIYVGNNMSGAVLPLSGQHMKFSFAPSNPAAVQAFGPQAFPPPVRQPSNLPNRGPMVPPTPPAVGGNVTPLAHNPAANVPRPSSTPTTNGRPASKRSSVTSNDSRPQLPAAAQQPNGRPTSKRDSITSRDGQAQQPSAPQPSGSFNAINRPLSNGTTASSAIVVDAESGEPAKKKRKSKSGSMSTPQNVKIAEQNGAPDKASGFPHPGAVVIDE